MATIYTVGEQERAETAYVLFKNMTDENGLTLPWEEVPDLYRKAWLAVVRLLSQA
jgi:hypothetical protein